jgi:hypothetical protein
MPQKEAGKLRYRPLYCGAGEEAEDGDGRSDGERGVFGGAVMGFVSGRSRSSAYMTSHLSPFG